jgi:hypothetical protein
VITIAIGTDQIGRVRRRSKPLPQGRRTLRDAPCGSPGFLEGAAKDVAMLGFCRAAMADGALLERPNKPIVDVANSELSHSNEPAKKRLQ